MFIPLHALAVLTSLLCWSVLLTKTGRSNKQIMIHTNVYTYKTIPGCHLPICLRAVKSVFNCVVSGIKKV